VTPDPWTNDDPESGDFDADLEAIDPQFVERRAGAHKRDCARSASESLRTTPML
jgi:hypothetical protein